MGRFVDKEHGFTLYDVPKGGGTTMRLWINYKYYGQFDMRKDETGYITQNNKSYDNLQKLGYKLEWFEKVTGECVCVKRDPIKRFVSCFNDKVLREPRIENKPEINHYVKQLWKHSQKGYPHDSIHPDSTKGKEVKYLKYHFAPQWKNLGKDPDYYKHVFDISEVNSKLRPYLEEKWSIELKELHSRKLKIKTSNDLTQKSKDILKEFYKEDYRLGWC